MAKKIKCAFFYRAVPFAIASYFRRTLERMENIELWTCGNYYGDFIDWNQGMHLPQKYVVPVDLPLPPTALTPFWNSIEPLLPWTPDIIIQVDAGFHFLDKPKCKIVATVATDAHVLDYSVPRSYSDFMFNMHPHFSKPGDIPLPYAADTTLHFPDPDAEIDHDAVLVGLHYQERDQWVAALRSLGLRVIYELGLVFDDYRKQVCRAPIGLNWSNKKDLNQRVFELMAMGRCPVIDRVPDMKLVGLEEDVHFLGFDALPEAVEKVEWALDNLGEAQKIAHQAREFVLANHTYQHRVNTILEECGLL